MHRLLNFFLFIVIVLLLIGIVVRVIPWLEVQQPVKILGGNHFEPGNRVPFEVKYKALIDVDCTVVRELIRVEKDIDYEIGKAMYQKVFYRGRREKVVYYDIPKLVTAPQLVTNSYVFKGTISYKPFGIIERRLSYTTEVFHVTVTKEHKVE